MFYIVGTPLYTDRRIKARDDIGVDRSTRLRTVILNTVRKEDIGLYSISYSERR